MGKREGVLCQTVLGNKVTTESIVHLEGVAEDRAVSIVEHRGHVHFDD